VASLQIPPWVHGPEAVGQQFLSSLREGAAITQEQQRMAQEANLRQMQMMLQQQESQRQNALEQQRLAQQQQYQQAEIGLRKQELEQAQKVNQIKIQESARLFQATQQFQKWMVDNPDKDPAEGILKFFPGTGESATGYGQLARSLFESRQKLGPPTVEEVEGQKFMRIPERGGNYRMQPIREGTADARRVNMRIQNLQRQAAALEKEIDAQAALYEGKDQSTMNDVQKRMFEAYQAKKKRLDTINGQIDEMYATGELDLGDGQTAPPGEQPPAALTWNPKTQQWEGGAQPTAKQSDIPPAPLLPPRAMMPTTGGMQLPTPGGAGAAFQPQIPSIPQTLRSAGQLGQQAFAPWALALQGGRNMMNIPATMQALKPIVPFLGRGLTNLVSPFLQNQPPIPPQLLQQQTEEQQQ
jgi:hypothetical protein